jgi:hypothetical protein
MVYETEIKEEAESFDAMLTICSGNTDLYIGYSFDEVLNGNYLTKSQYTKKNTKVASLAKKVKPGEVYFLVTRPNENTGSALFSEYEIEAFYDGEYEDNRFKLGTILAISEVDGSVTLTWPKVFLQEDDEEADDYYFKVYFT